MSNSTPTPAAHRLGLVGRKVGMTRIFTEEGESIPVTVLDVSNNRVTQVKSVSYTHLTYESIARTDDVAGRGCT